MNKKKGNKRKHINLRERIKIEHWLEVGIKQKEIAERLKRSPSTISKEIKYNSVIYQKTKRKEYRATKAHIKAYLKQYRKKKDCLKVSMHIPLRIFVEKRIIQG